jgi:hypothetical protein
MQFLHSWFGSGCDRLFWMRRRVVNATGFVGVGRILNTFLTITHTRWG